MAKQSKIPGMTTQRLPAGDGAEPGHMIVVTDHGLAMIVAGLRKVVVESPEVRPLLDTLQEALRKGIAHRPDVEV